MGLVAIEDFLVGDTKALFGKKLKAVDHLPGKWDADTLKRLAQNAPCVYWSYLGGKKNSKHQSKEDSVFQCYVFTSGGSEEKQRRRGDRMAPGAYYFVEILQDHYDDLPVPNEDALKLLRTDNLFSDFLHANGITGYVLAFQLLRGLDTDLTPDQLGDFLVLGTEYPQQDGAPPVGDVITIPQ